MPARTEERFAFGKNWVNYSNNALTAERVARARQDFLQLCAGVEFNQRRFLDIGFGQGLGVCFASEQGAKVFGIDIDAENLAAFERTKSFFRNCPDPQLIVGSILDQQSLIKLNESGPFEIVHAWGSLHHTGELKRAIVNAATLVAPHGHLILAIYNRHWASPVWRIIKQMYVKAPAALKKVMVTTLYCPLFVATLLYTGKSPSALPRGMNFYNDLVDWVGGYPYEYLSADELCACLGKKFELIQMFRPPVPTGNNQLVFRRVD